MQHVRTFLLVTVLCVWGLGCIHRPRHLVGDLPPAAFTVPETVLHEVTLDDGSIPERYWGEPIRVLHPLRVYRDRVNIAVVTKLAVQEERGVYFYVPTSSYFPGDAPGRKFRWNKKTGFLQGRRI
ncbi:MAG: hypothetical protein HOP33_16000 [Verrucomicrobia bacterium]|nr:hypothetical protein [Verrucomicrobiota bacterium]